jgi:hypothetical protein
LEKETVSSITGGSKVRSARSDRMLRRILHGITMGNVEAGVVLGMIDQEDVKYNTREL